jgi:hypothetical protein
MSKFSSLKWPKTCSFLSCVLVLAVSLCVEPPLWGNQAGGAATSGANKATGSNAVEATQPQEKSIWDPAKYISLDEIKPGMEAYCLTEYDLAGVEKFGLKVVDVIRNIEPGRDAILVRGTEGRFIDAGPVAGCSGSPVYIDGRLAGALALSWAFSKEPLYAATPIAEMLKVGEERCEGLDSGYQMRDAGYVFDFSKPIDFAEIDKQITTPRHSVNSQLAGVTILPCPLLISGLPANVFEQAAALVEPLGLMAIPGLGGGMNRPARGQSPESKSDKQDVKLVPGACLAVPLISGDITMSIYGTVTEVMGDKVYGFGHSLGYGPVDLPMATGKVHTVASNMVISFKIASVVETVGALTTDEGAGVLGQIGAKAKMIPLTILVDRYNDTQKRVYNCQLANNRRLTPIVLRLAVAGAALYLGDFPLDHTIEYKVDIGLGGAKSISFQNVSTGLGLGEVIMESMGSVVLLMNNPFKKVDIESIDFNIRILPRNIASHIWSVDLSDSEVKAGDDIEIGVVVESVRTEKKEYQCRLKIPEDLAAGKYELTVCGWQDYISFLLKSMPYKFIAQNMPGLIDALNYSLGIERDKMFCLLALPPQGVAVEQAELPDLPATKALVLQDAKRVLTIQPYQHWIERSLKTGTVILDRKVMSITVKK